MKFSVFLVVNDKNQPLCGDTSYKSRFAIFQTKMGAEKYIENYENLMKSKYPNSKKRGRKIIKTRIEFNKE